jgi:hypothetical protein
MQVNFKFDMDDSVITPLGDKGIIFSCLLDNSLFIQYYVLMKGGQGSYFREDQIMLDTSVPRTGVTSL